MNDQDVLRIFRETGALLDGHFVLRSGLHSRQFFQCALLLQYPETSSKLCAALASRLDPASFDCVISPAMGGILVGHDIARHLGKKHVFAEKQEGKLAVRRFALEAGVRYLVAEDVITTGSAVREVIQIVRDSGGTVAAVACIVDRSGGSVELGSPLHSLLRLKVETYQAEQLPEDLKKIPAVKPGSK
jgi:orotate phosphoribosyltransferase